MKRIVMVLLVFATALTTLAQTKRRTENLIVITIDGARWQEVFKGADSTLFFSDKFGKSYARKLKGKFWAPTAGQRREKLMPFVWGTIAKQGRLYGNRQYDNKVSVKNLTNISYPGYAEIFTGYPDPAIKSNDALQNPNSNVFEFINKQPEYQGKVASFASWNRVENYLNKERSGYLINGGYNPFPGNDLSPLQQTLNSLQALMDKGDHSRADYITYLNAKEHLRLKRPKVMSIGFAWTDDAAHDGSYPLYLENIFCFDAMIADLWSYVQSLPEYKDKTSLLITVDHGRGEGDEWVSHGPSIAHANEMWFAVMGPDISARGEMKSSADIHQHQFAQTMAHMLGLTFKSTKPTGMYISDLFK